MLSGRAYHSTALAGDALAVLDAEGLQSAHVVATGWAAETALTLAATAPQRVSSLVLAAPYVPALVADQAEAPDRQIGSAHLEMMQEAAALAEKGQTDRALDLFLGARIGADWRDRFPKPRLGAIRRSAGNLPPLLAGTASAPIDPDAFTGLDMPVWLLIKEDAGVLERATVEILDSLLPRARIGALPPGPNEQLAVSSEWTDVIATVLTSAPTPFPVRMPSPNR
jgi:pimeloyl-ACP methyl ester carboxylesterase